MTGVVFAILAIASAWAGPLDVERGLAALELERPEEAREHAVEALRQDVEDWMALRLYADALDAGGSTVLVIPELDGLSALGANAGVMRDWYRIEVEEAALDTFGEHPAAADFASFALASLALDGGAPEVTLAAMEGADEPHELGLKLEAMLALGQDRDAAALAKSIIRDHPDHPDATLMLFGGEAGSGAVRRARKWVLDRVTAMVEEAKEPVALYRARKVLARAGDKEGAARAVERLVHMGEAAPLGRAVWSVPMRRSMARALGMKRNPEIPPGTPSEVREIGLSVAVALRDMGRVQESLAVFEAVRQVADSTEIALVHGEQLLRMGRAGEALEVADAARRLASGPSQQDLARLSTRGWRAELGAAWVLTATALAANERWDEALEAAVAGALVHPTADAYVVLGRSQEALGQEEAAFASYAVAQSLGAQVSASLAATWWGAGDWEDAAIAVAERWARETSTEIPTAEIATVQRKPTKIRPRVGAPLPEWSLQTEQGPIGGESTAGQVVVLAFWASWCGPCRLELPELARLAHRLEEGGAAVTIVAVSVDDRQRDYRRFIERTDLEGLVVGWSPDLGRRFRVTSLPTTWIVDSTGTVRHYHQGYGPGSGRQIQEEIEALLGS
jgi:thiol-disulfide isomerase/thioredoxin